MFYGLFFRKFPQFKGKVYDINNNYNNTNNYNNKPTITITMTIIILFMSIAITIVIMSVNKLINKILMISQDEARLRTATVSVDACQS